MNSKQDLFDMRAAELSEALAASEAGLSRGTVQITDFSRPADLVWEVLFSQERQGTYGVAHLHTRMVFAQPPLIKEVGPIGLGWRADVRGGDTRLLGQRQVEIAEIQELGLSRVILETLDLLHQQLEAAMTPN